MSDTAKDDAMQALQDELRTMRALARWMDELSPESQARVLAWLTAKYAQGQTP